MKRLLAISALAVIGDAVLTPQPAAQAAQPAIAVNAIDGILAVFRDYRIVGLGEGPHNNIAGHRFRLSLIRDPRFPTVVNDIVVEAGTARYQAVMDRFVNGDTVPRSELRRVWEDTTVPNAVFDRPIYEEFYHAVRDVNLKLPKERRLRVLLGEPPIAWEAVKSAADLRRWGMQRDGHAVAVIKRDVLAKNRRALIVYGDGHFQGRGFPQGSITVRLEREGEKVFTISNSFADLKKYQPDAAGWKVPSLAHIKGTPIGTRFYAQFYPMPPAPGWNTVLMQDQFDAVLYLGGPSAVTFSQLPKQLCDDAAYMKMRLARLALNPNQRATPAEQFKRYCASISQ